MLRVTNAQLMERYEELSHKIENHDEILKQMQVSISDLTEAVKLLISTQKQKLNQERDQESGPRRVETDDDSTPPPGKQEYQLLNRMTKLEFPAFDGDAFKEWHYKCNQFFELDNTPENMKIRLVAIHLKGRALQWHQGFMKDMEGKDVSWKMYLEELREQFIGGIASKPLIELRNLKLTTTVSDYNSQFNALRNQVDIPPEVVLDLYVGGLSNEIVHTVVGADSELELPQVAVVGSQSSGKSNVLEALVGRDFLPRGSDICSRRPLLLQLVRTDKEAGEYGELGHLPGRNFFDFSQIRAEIQPDHGSLVLNILLKYSKAFVSLVDGRNEEKLTSEVYGGARIHYIFQSIFVSRLEEVDAFEQLSDEDIRTAIHNATGPRSALFVPEVPFQVLIRRQIARLLDPSLQCARLVYNELVKMSHSCLVHELQRFSLLKTCINEIVGNFLLEGLEPSQTMIGHIVEMEVDYINTSHPNFIGGNKAVEVASHQVRSNRLASPTSRQRDGVDSDAVAVSGSNRRSNAIVARSQSNGIVVDQGVRSVADINGNGSSGGERGSNWRIASFFRGREVHNPAVDISRSNSGDEILNHKEHVSSIIHLREPPLLLNSSEMHSEHEAEALAVTKQLLESYYTIVKEKVQDSVPKAIMHFLVNHTKRELCNVLIENLYRESLFEKLLQETDEVSLKRKHVEKLS